MEPIVLLQVEKKRALKPLRSRALKPPRSPPPPPGQLADGGEPPATLLSLPDGLLMRLMSLDGFSNCLAAARVNQRLRRLGFDTLASRAAEPAAICAAAKAGSVTAVEVLLDAGADINAVAAKDKLKPVHQAAASGNMRMLRFLLERGASRDDAGRHSPVILAAKGGHADVVAELLDRWESAQSADDVGGSTQAAGAANIDWIDHPSGTRLLKAALKRPTTSRAMERRKVVLRLLLDRVQIWDTAIGQHGRQLLQGAMECGDEASVRRLLAGGVQPASHMCWAAKNGIDAAVRLLAKCGVNVNEPQCVGGDRPLYLAALCARYPTVTTLVDLGADPNGESGPHAATALHIAAEYGDMRLAELLLEHHADPDAPLSEDCFGFSRELYEGDAVIEDEEAAARSTQGGWTPLHLAAFHDHGNICIQLLAAGADRNAMSVYDKTPLDVADEHCSEDAAAVLRSDTPDASDNDDYYDSGGDGWG